MASIGLWQFVSFLFVLVAIPYVNSTPIKCFAQNTDFTICTLNITGIPNLDVKKLTPESQSKVCIKNTDYKYIFFNEKQAFIYVTKSCGGTFELVYPSEWNAWGSWSACSVSCGFGVQNRIRTCTSGRSEDCAGQDRGSVQFISCAVEQCSGGGTTKAGASWNAWNPWDACSVSCGLGARLRNRLCSTGNNADCSKDGVGGTQIAWCINSNCNGGGGGVTTTTTTTTAATTAKPIVPNPSFCGIAPVNNDQYRIIGGTRAENCQYPWAVMLYNRQKSTLCGGTIIDASHVLTAAHCVVGRSVFGMYTTAARNVVVFSGSSKMPLREHISTIPGIARRAVSKVKVHQDYDDDNLDNDIAILTLSNPIRFDQCHVPVCLPSMHQSVVGQTCETMGWGKTGNDLRSRTSPNLLHTQVKVESDYTCASVYQYYYNAKTKMCAGGNGTGACGGDSGGPLICTGSDGKSYLHGVVSAGESKKCGLTQGLYTRVSSYLSWIKLNTK